MARLREAWVERRMILDASALDEAAMESFARRLRAEQPVMLLAYANTLGLFARYVRQSGFSGIRPRAIITSAEVLTEENRALIQSVFGCPVFNRYGCREFAVIASQCEAQGPLHVNAENLLVETLANGAPVTGTPGELVITDLRNLAMPMIRYAIRDTGVLVAGSCSCGRHLPRLEMAAGRVTDFLTATNGQKVSGIVIATYVSTHIPGIGQMQIEQHEHGRVSVRVVRGNSWDETARERLVARLREYLGATMQVDVVYVDAIPHERSGKFRFSISHL
jgi:phenylacetate-CoA ligase